MQATITIPYAIADFAEMRERGFYYVDKTDYIAKLENYKAPIFLRPRRFGKSLLVSRYLSGCYTFAIEQNNSRGRADFEMTGIPGTDFYTDDRLVEFKYYKAAEAEKMLAVDAPLPEHIEQVHGYAQDTLRKFPNYKVRTYVAYICANRGWKCWEVTNS